MLQVELRNVNLDDVKKIFDWRNQLFIRSKMFNSDEIPFERHLEWYNSFATNNNRIAKIFSFNRVDYGVLNISAIDEKLESCEWGFYIGDEQAPKGTGLLLGYTSLEYIFEDLKMRKICAQVIESNQISRKFHEKLGFKLDGILRKHIKRDKHYEDVYVYSLFIEEWQEISGKIKVELEGRFK
ncbi:UDP-4-amino-4,6-dideoxy-N-acetyl-beta-L-altrosamine N-acetyltransferase [Lysinibacillus sphaericus]|uniref:GNAT family acetyltransferase n=1 Tax=Lysinibacillus sphaericus OT4b.31 TaxID=1285586 RepID=R7Z8Z3_LYSSH|nr:UDP-4-amino-4,6-dideoxy-N-acetyl-beta-L-altrosamine N-acetyltransferase [Lysinibacillus sphaericus]EON70441.1 GNAT family acetyltransferase [Lysinibacillus sphaericus OT4b.31]